MVLEQATKLTTDTQVRFAALVHDLGKATTPQEIWPSHHGHGERGVELINRLCNRLRIPNRYRNLANLVARYHLNCHRIQELSPTVVLGKLEGLDAFRRPERFDQFLLACEADARGRKGKEQQDYPQAEMFRKYRSACLAVDTKSADLRGLEGSQIAEYIHGRRVEAIKQVKAQEIA